MSPTSIAHATIETFAPASQAELAQFVGENASQSQHPLYPAGGGTALDYGYTSPDPGITLSSGRLTQVIEYPARDMTITVEAGISVDALEALLRTERQRLPIDVPQSGRATLGGIVATNTSGPLRFGFGTLRDYVIGISAVDAAGSLFKAGGRVVKNVAGYDLCKLLIGSLGTLAVVTQVTLKLRPLPELRGGIWATFPKLADLEAVLSALLTSGARPVIVEAINPFAAQELQQTSGLDLPHAQPALYVGFEGGGTETAWQLQTLSREIGTFRPQQLIPQDDAAAEKLRRSLTEFPAMSGHPLTFQANLLPSKAVEFLVLADERGMPLVAHAGNGIVIGHLTEPLAGPESAATILTPLRRFAREGRGNLALLNCPSAWKDTLPLFGDPDTSWTLMRHLKSQLDPRDILNRGRLFQQLGANGGERGRAP